MKCSKYFRCLKAHQLNIVSFCCRTTLKLESLEDAVVLDDPEEDLLQDKRGCPAYVSPEILRAHRTYSGRAADMWSLGVILYTMLVGRCVLDVKYDDYLGQKCSFDSIIYEGAASSPASVGLTVFKDRKRVASTVGEVTEARGMITCRPLRANGLQLYHPHINEASEIFAAPAAVMWRRR
jgi:serine/threonine protein kinase